jgi:hypothetical protein
VEITGTFGFRQYIKSRRETAVHAELQMDAPSAGSRDGVVQAKS